MEINEKKLHLYELVWIFFGILSVISVFLLSFNWFSPSYSLLISIILFIGTLIFLKKHISIKDNRWGLVIILILAVGLLLRSQPWPYLEGGQDEGLYMSLSSQFDSSKSFKFEDIAEKFLNPQLKSIYLEDRSWAVLGMKKDETTGNLFYDFYPLHPMLMSITATVFGDIYRVYSITFFSILSIAGAYLLTSKLANSKKAGYIAAGILAVMPLHLYFSRFPVTEIIALAITLNFLYFLLVAYKEKNYPLLYISILLVNMFLYLRLTWVVAMPFCILVFIVILLYSKNEIEIKNWIKWGLLLYGSYLVSLLFYFIHYNYILDHFYGKIYRYIPENIFYALIFLLPLIIWILIKFLKMHLRNILNFLYRYRIFIIWIAFILLGLYAGYLFYKVAFTTKYLNTTLDRTWGMANVGWYALKDQIPVSIILHLSPFALLPLLFFSKKINSPERFLLTFFLFLFLAFNIIVVRYTPYQIYYARYQLSEIIPIAVILSSIFLFEALEKHRFFVTSILICMFAYNIFFSVYQYQGYVGTTPKFFNTLSETVNKSDFVIYFDPTDWSKSFLFSPLKYYYNYPSLHTTTFEKLETFANGISGDSETKVFVLSTKDLNELGKSDGSKYEYIKTIKYERGFFANAVEAKPPLDWIVNDNTIPYCTTVAPYKYCGGLIPIKYHLGSINIMLYEYKEKR